MQSSHRSGLKLLNRAVVRPWTYIGLGSHAAGSKPDIKHLTTFHIKAGKLVFVG